MIISVIIPVYNVEKYVERCLKTIAAQTFSGETECIVVGDAATDASMKIAESFVAAYKGHISFKLLYHSQNRGLAAARNTGVAAAQGDYIFHLDSDDYCDHDALEKMYSKAIETDADIVVTDYWETCIDREVYYSNNIPQTIEARVKGVLAREYSQVIYSKFIKRSLYTDNSLSQVEGVDYGEDVLMTVILMYYAQKVVHLPEAFVHHINYNENSYTFSISDKAIRDIYECDKNAKKFIIERGCYDLYKDYLLKSRVLVYLLLVRHANKNQRKLLKSNYKNISLKMVCVNPVLNADIKFRFATLKIGQDFRVRPLALFTLEYLWRIFLGLRRRIKKLV